jgi:hypothetical protein
MINSANLHILHPCPLAEGISLKINTTILLLFLLIVEA